GFSPVARLAAGGGDAKPKAREEAAVPKHDDHPASPVAGAAAPAAPPGSAPAGGGGARELDVASVNLHARVRVKVPAAWTISGLQVVLRDEFQEAVAGV